MLFRSTPVTLGPINDDVRSRPFCGPTVISCITGAPVSTIRGIIRGGRVNATRSDGSAMPVRGISPDELARCFLHLGFDCRLVEEFPPAPVRPTLAGLMQLRRRDDLDCYVVGLAVHFVAVQGRMFVDTFTKGQPVPLRTAPGRRSRVHAVWLVRRL